MKEDGRCEEPNWIFVTVFTVEATELLNKSKRKSVESDKKRFDGFAEVG